MAEIGIKDLKSGASRVIREVSGGRSYVVTSRGRAAAVIMPIEEAEDLVLANAEEFVSMRRRARAAYRKGRFPSTARPRLSDPYEVLLSPARRFF